MKSVYRKKVNLLSVLLFIFSVHTVCAQVTLQWTKPASLNANLPPSVQVYQTTSPIAGAPLKAYYMIADLADGDIELKAVSGNGASKTLPQFVQDESETVFAIINGGFFSGNQNLSLVSHGGVVSAPNIKTVTRTFNGAATAYHPTRGAFGILNTNQNQPDVAWVYNVGTTNTTYFYTAPNANSGNGTIANAAPEPQPTDVFPSGAALWNVTTAIGGSPVLIANGVKQITDSEELIDANNGNKEPRTAVGYTATGKVIFLVVEGRNAEVSNGATLNELADIMLSLGCQEALNLDGGGSSAMQVLGQNTIRPSDAGGILRTTPSAFMLKRKPRVFDTENATIYSEVGTFANSANTGFYGNSQSRQIVAGTGSNKAVYRFADLPPGRYKVEAWWVAAPNRATNTPFTIHRQGNFPRETIRLNQTTAARFNLLGTFNLATGDSVVISNDALPTGSFVNVDAIRLTKVSELALTISFSNGDASEHVKGTDIAFSVAVRSPVNGVYVKNLKIFKQRGTETETQVGGEIALNNTLSDTYNFVYNTVNDDFGTIKFRFESEDNFDQRVSKIYAATITPLTQVVFDPATAAGKHETDKNINLMLQLDTRRSEVKLSELKVFKSVNNGAETQVGTTVSLTESTQTIPYSYLVSERPADQVKLRFEVKSDNGETGQRTYTARIIPKRGDYRIAVVSDLNSSFGSVTYEYQVDSIMKRIPRLFNPNMVVCGGDMVAGQLASLTSTQLDAMWAAFDTKVATPFRNANIPFAFTVGNHDAADGFALERQRTRHYWRTPGKYPGMHPIDTTNYPFYFSYMDKPDGDIFYVTWDANSSIISSAELEWTKQQFASEAAKKAKFRFLVGHLPLYGIAQERDSPGNVLPQPDALRQWMEELDVHTYISGHQHAYYPAKRGKLELLNTGAAGSGPRRWLSIDKAPVNTITLMDVFYEQDTIVYTTYDIKNIDAEAMTLFNEKELPEIINGFQGFVVRRDVKLKNSATGALSSLNLIKSRKHAASGQATVTIVADTARITGTFATLEGVLLRERTAVSLYRGLHGEDGKMITDLKVISTNGKSGSFSGALVIDKDFRELLSTGSFYVLFKTDLFPEGEVRTQLYPHGNQAPPAAIITSQNATEVYAVRDIPGLFTVSWGAAKDPETNPVTYTYQLATNNDYTNILIDEGEGRSTSFSRTQAEMYALLGGAAENQPVSFFHRVIASDGKNIVYGTSQELRLAKSNAPVVGVIELLPPHYQFNCSAGIDNITLQCSAPFAVGSSSNTQGIAVDRFGKVWYGINAGGLWVKNVDGSAYRLTSPDLTYSGTGVAERVTSYTFGGTIYTLPTTGLGTDADGNILVAASTRVVKFDAVTGQPLALFIAPTGTAQTFTNPTADTEGRIFVASVNLGNNNFIIKQNGTAFDIVANNFALEGRELARASAMSPNGRTIYIPANAGRNIHKYTSTDGINFVREKVIVSPSAGGCNSVLSPENNVLYSIINASGPEGAKLAVWDDNTNTFWSRELKEIPANFSTHTTANMRGLAITPNKDSVYVVNNAFGSVYRYIIPKDGDGNESTVTDIPTYHIQQIRKANLLGVADSLGVYCRLVGVVNSQNFKPDGLDLAINDGEYGIQVYKNAGNANYTTKTGDRIAVMGYLRQVNGLLRIETDSIRLVNGNEPISLAREVNLLSDSIEYFPVRLKRVKLKSQTQWTPNRGYLGFEVEATDGTNSAQVFVSSITDVFGVEVPLGEFEVSGLGNQFKINSPFTSGFQLVPRSTAEIVFTNIKKMAKDSLVINSVERIPVKAVGSFRPGNTYTLQLSDQDGLFNNPTLIPVTIVNDSIRLQVPLLRTGKGYKVRVQSSDPALYSNEYNVAISCARLTKPVIMQASNSDFTVATLTSSLAPTGGTYQWSVNGTAIAGATEQRYTTSEVGSYTVRISLADCHTTSDPFVFVITANEPSVLSEFILYPNPVKDWFTLSLTKWRGKKAITVYQSSGKVMTAQETNGEQININAADYSPGLYFVKVTATNSVGVLKFIKQ